MVREFADASAEGDAVETSSAGPSDRRERFAHFGRPERSDEDRAHVAARVGERPVELDAADPCACAYRPKARAVRRSSTVCASGSRNSSCRARNYRCPTLQRRCRMQTRPLAPGHFGNGRGRARDDGAPRSPFGRPDAVRRQLSGTLARGGLFQEIPRTSASLNATGSNGSESDAPRPRRENVASSASLGAIRRVRAQARAALRCGADEVRGARGGDVALSWARVFLVRAGGAARFRCNQSAQAHRAVHNVQWGGAGDCHGGHQTMKFAP